MSTERPNRATFKEAIKSRQEEIVFYAKRPLTAIAVGLIELGNIIIKHQLKDEPYNKRGGNFMIPLVIAAIWYAAKGGNTVEKEIDQP